MNIVDKSFGVAKCTIALLALMLVSICARSQNIVDLNKGLLNVSIPVYDYNDPDFNMPVSMTYASGGFKPNMHASDTGLGWNLIAGGKITRTIRGYDDFDQKTGYHWSSFVPWGIPYLSFTGIKHDDVDQNPALKYIDKSPAFFKFKGILGVTVGYPINNTTYDTSPDIFSFSFLGYSGKFYICPGQAAVVFDTNRPYGEYTIRMDTDPKARNPTRTSFTITTGNGYEYTFENTAYEGYYYPSNYQIAELYTHEIEWSLTKIVAPNGRTVNLSYSGYSMSERVAPSYSYRPHYHATAWVTAHPQTIYATTMLGFYHYQTLTKFQKQLREITVDKLRISFRYSDRVLEQSYTQTIDGVTADNRPAFQQATSGSLMGVQKLEAMTVTSMYGPTLLKTCQFAYDYASAPDTNPIMFLKSIDISGEGTYKMDYYHAPSKALPKHGSGGFDHWGFWNQSNNHPSELIPDSESAEDSYINSELSPRAAYYDANNTLMLKTLYYPTGGASVYVYEPHRYSQKVYRKKPVSSYDNGWPLVRNASELLTGGVRIKSIYEYIDSKRITDPSVAAIKRTFSYEKSGILLHYPKYRMPIEYMPVYKEPKRDIKGNLIYETQKAELISSNGVLPYPMDNSHIGYSKVKEINADGSYVVNEYTDYVRYPDTKEEFRFTDTPYPLYPSNCLYYFRKSELLYMDQMMAHLYSKASLRGKIRERTIYDNKNKEVKKEAFAYSYASKDNKDMYEIMPAVSLFYVHRLQVGTVLMNSYKVTYGEEDKISTAMSFEYNSLGQLVATRTKNSDGTNYISINYYSNDYEYKDPLTKINITPCPQTKEDNMLASRHILCVPRASTLAKYTDDQKNIEILQRSRNTYDKVNDGVQAPMALKSMSRAPLIKPLSNVDYSDKILDEEIIVNKHNALGRPVEIWTRQRGTTSIIWGYDGLYPIAVVQNAAFDAVSNAVGAHSDELTAKQSEALRELPNALVSTYKYNPFIGVTSIVDPSGRSMFYEYDSAGRLVTLKDDQYNMLQEYIYNVGR